MSLDGPLIFVSHADEDKDVAILLKDLILRAAPSKLRVYVSSDIGAQRLGEDWLKGIRERLSEAAVVVFLASPSSLEASFALFEFGAALFNNPQPKIIPICISGLRLPQLPDPFHRYHSSEATTPLQLHATVDSILHACGVDTAEALDWDGHHIAFRNAQEEWLVVEPQTFSACSFETLSRLEPLLSIQPGRNENRLYQELIGQVLQKMTFHGSPVDDRFLAVYGNLIKQRQDWNSQKKLAYVVSSAQQGKIVTARKDSYAVMDILRRQVSEYRATATDEELLRPESKEFLFASADPQIYRLFILRKGKQTLVGLDEDRLSALKEQIRRGVQVRILKWDEEGPPPNFGIYGHMAVGRLSPAGINQIEFHSNAVNTCKEEFDGLWLRGERVLQI
jgi:hypothetical protein